MQKIRWGILSTAKIGVEKVIPAMQNGRNCEICAIASRDKARAEEAAENLNIPKAYGSYEALLRDPDIDAVYNPLPNHLHAPWSIRSLEAGKHVLCEKPVALSVQEAREMQKAAAARPELKLMEAFMYKFHPQWIRSKAWIKEGRIGELRTVHSFFAYYNTDPGNIRNMADIGGGGLMDIGCYNISLSRYLFDAEPIRVSAIMETDPRFKTDRLTSGLLVFESGKATFTCSTQLSNYQRVQIFGTEGRIEIEIPFNAPNDRPCKIWLHQNSNVHEKRFKICDQYTLQGEQFSQSILDDRNLPVSFTDAISNMKVIEAVQESAAQNRWAEI